MQIDKSAQEGAAKCWLNPDEFDVFTSTAADISLRHRVVVQLGGRCGLRSFEIPQVRPLDITEADEQNHYFLHIPRGKDTQGEGGKPRDAYLPADVERDLLELRYSEDVDRDEPFFDVTERRIQQMVKEAACRVAERIENGEEFPSTPEKWQKVSSHDLRRYFAHNMLVRERVNPRVVMDVGGWESMENLEPYLSKPTEGVIIDELGGTA